MKTGKRLLMILLSVILIFGSLPINTQAAVKKGTVKSLKVTSTPANVLVVKKGQSYKLKVKVTAKGSVSKKVAFKSANEKVATVTAAGKVKGIKKGSTKITVSSIANPKVKKVIKVKVGTPIKKISVSTKNVTLTEGDNYKLSVKFSPKKPTYKKLSFTTSNKEIATVNKKGEITALAVGQVTITAKTMDGSNKKAKCVITVNPKADANSSNANNSNANNSNVSDNSVKPSVSDNTTTDITSIKLNLLAATMDVGAKQTLAVKILPAGATDKGIIWSSSDAGVAEVSDRGEVNALKAGKTVITAKTANGCVSSCEITVVDGHTGDNGSTSGNDNTGNTGDSGNTSDSDEGGNTSDSGNTGDSGNTSGSDDGGNTSDSGNTGDNGSTSGSDDGGNTSDSGSTGDSGNTSGSDNGGNTSDSGNTGDNGNTSDSGNTGDSGNTSGSDDGGNTGDSGNTGDNGNTSGSDNGGNTSDSGSTGDNGNTSDSGNTGDNGNTSDSGNTGDNGSTGDGDNSENPPAPIEVVSVSLDKTAINMIAGDQAQIVATVSPSDADDKTITWTSGNQAVATVNASGKVTAVSVGTAIISAKSVNGKEAKCTVTVTKKTVAVSSVALNMSEASLEEGATVDLTATVSPSDADDQTITWTSGNQAVATVNASGTVTAVSAGTAIITAKTVNGKTATCQITVKAVNVAVTSITLAKAKLNLEPTENYGLKATILPLDADNREIAWSSSNPEVVKVNETGTLVAMQTGTVMITAKASNGLSATCEVKVVDRVLDSMFEIPYVSTYYFNPKPSVNEEIKIPLYITDYEQSEYLKNDTTKTLDLYYEIDGVEKSVKNLAMGDYTLNIGKLSEGMHTIAIQSYDPIRKLRSHKLYNELWVINPATYEITEAQTYKMTQQDLIKYQINNNDSKNEDDLINTRDGLSKMFDDLQKAGYRKCILLKGTYRINGEDARETCITIPSYFTVDMNGSTFKLNTISNEASASIVRMYEAIDAHLINGTLEGDRFERQELDLERQYLGEPINTVMMRGGKYCSISDLTIKNTTGHTVVTAFVWGKNRELKQFSRTAIVNGEEVANENCSTSEMVDLTEFINWDPTERYIYVGHPGGYRGINGESGAVYVHFYDADKKFLETVTGYQFRKMRIVDNAKYAKVTFAGNEFPYADIDKSVSIYQKHLGDYYEYTNIDFVDTRTTAIAASVCNNLLIDNVTYTRAGNSITPCSVDFEDGWEECQDVYYRNVRVLEKAPRNTATVVDDAGLNHVYENIQGHSVVMRNRVYGGVFRNIDDKSTTINWTFNKIRLSGKGRCYHNTCGNITFGRSSSSLLDLADFKVKDCTIYANRLVSMPEHVVYENCVFPTFSGNNGRFVNCTLQPNSYLEDQLYFKDCTFKVIEGDADSIGFSFNSPANAQRVFENCKFVGKTVLNNHNMFHSATFKDCTFDDVSMVVAANEAKETILFDGCTINSTAPEFIRVGPFAYTTDYMNLIFKDCDITHSGNKLLYLYAKPSENSQLLFDHCTIHKNDGMLVDGDSIHNLSDRVSLDIRFVGSEVSRELKLDSRMDPEKIRISYE